MAITIDKRYIKGPQAFSCNYSEHQEKKDVYNWLVDNFGGEYPNLDYDHIPGTNNGRWRVNDDYIMAERTMGGFTIRFRDEEDAIAFKLRWS